MTLFQSILLGIVQGLTEFIPISSSGHLVLVPHLLGWQLPAEDAFIFDVLVQVATLVAVFAYFWNDLVAIARDFFLGIINRRPFGYPQSCLAWYLVLATIPAGAMGLLIRSSIEQAFGSPEATGFFLFVTSGLLLIAEKAGRRVRSLEHLTWRDALWIGCFQIMSLFPGVSRSGATIAGGMTRDLQRPDAARFSFLMSIPIMLAAGLLAAWDLKDVPNLEHTLPLFIPGFITAAVVGYISIRWLIGFLTRRPLYVFAAYCAGMGGLIILLARLAG